MPTVSHNGQSFNIDGRRLWVLGATLHYARIPRALWAERISDAKQAGFNTIETACPWMVHEPRAGRFVFDGDADVKQFVTLAAEADMRVILRAGPFVGSGYDGGGLPNWLGEDTPMRLREANEAFLARVGKYFRRLMGELAPLQASKGGPILLIQVEHQWMCANDAQADRYLREIARILRELGVAVPLINANNLWLDAAGTIDTWCGDDDLLANLRQLRTVQPGVPRVVRVFESVSSAAWGQTNTRGLEASDRLRRLAETLAAGAQPIVTPFHGGTNFGFLGGRPPGQETGYTTSAATAAPLGEAGARGTSYHLLRRLVTFADAFSNVFADLDPDYHPVALDPAQVGVPAARGRPMVTTSIVPLRGPGGRVIFVFGSATPVATTLLLDNGVRLPIDLGDQPVGWYLIDVDLDGKGHLDYANLCPFALVDRSLFVLFGPARADVYLSINGTPLEASVPGGAKPLVMEHKGITIIICNQEQMDTIYCSEDAVYAGIDGFDLKGAPRHPAGTGKAWVITKDEGLATLTRPNGAAKSARTTKTARLGEWQGATSAPHASGESPRYASLPGPRSLAECGAPTGYGWYAIDMKVGAARKRLTHIPGAGGRMHLYADGKAIGIIGEGPGATPGPTELKLNKGPLMLTALVDNTGRFADGNDLAIRMGLHDHLHELKRVTTTKPKKITTDPVDPFQLRGFILGATASQGSSAEQIEWSFTHAKKTPLVVVVNGAEMHGTFVLNETAIAYFAGVTGSTHASIRLDPTTLDPFKRGRNVLRFAPDPGQSTPLKSITDATTVYECADALTKNAIWSFAKWEPPPASAYTALTTANASKFKGIPAWWKSTVKAINADRPWWVDTTGLSKGQVFVNGNNVGRYFTATASGRAIGPQVRLYLSPEWLNADAPNEILIFDEHGFTPQKTKLASRVNGDLD